MSESDVRKQMPVLVRLSFWISPDRQEAFETDYQATILPMLTKLGLNPASSDRPSVNGVVSYFFEVTSPSEATTKTETLLQDTSWLTKLRELGITYGTSEPDGLIRYRFGLISTPAGSGTAVPLNKKAGHWRTYSMREGLPGGIMRTGF